MNDCSIVENIVALKRGAVNRLFREVSHGDSKIKIIKTNYKTTHKVCKMNEIAL